MAKKKFYAVRKGFKTGIFNTWTECSKQISGFKGAEFKSFPTKEEAENFISGIKKEIEIDENTIEAYVDGSYEHSIKKYGSGIVILKNKEVIHKESFGGKESEYISMRNVAGEIKASEYAMNYCIKNNIPRLILYYDYQGIEKWCTGDWKANKQGTIEYRDFYNSVKNKLEVTFVKVAAHTGDTYNEMADKLAKEGLNK